MVTVVVFFIVLVNVAKGLRQVSPTHLELMRSYAAARRAVLHQGARAERRALPVHGAQDRRARGGDHRLRGGVLRRLAERTGLAHRVEHRHLEERRRLGVRARRLPARSDVLPDLHLFGERHHTQQGWKAPGEHTTHEATSPPEGNVNGRQASRGQCSRCRSSPPRAATTTRRPQPVTEAPADDGTGRDRGDRRTRGDHRARGAPTGAGGDHRDRRPVTCESATPVKLQLQWFVQAQFAGYFAAVDQGFYDDECLDVEILEGGVDIVPQKQLADGAADFAIAWVPKALADPRGRRRHRQHRPDLPALGHLAGVVQGRGHHHRRTTSTARRSATGASATSTRSSPRSRRPVSIRRPTSSSCSSSST